MVAITGADGGVTSFAYDAAGRLSYAMPEVDDEAVVAFCPATRAIRTSSGSLAGARRRGAHPRSS